MLQPTEIQRLLVVMAHPDDVDFGSAGTIATLTEAGVHVTYCLVTDGNAGGSDRTVSRAAVAALRRLEQTAAAAVLDVNDLVFLGHPDGRVVADLALRCDISRVIRQVRPQVVLCQSPERNLDRIFASHPDHLAAGEAAISAVYPDSRNPFAFPELLEQGLEPWDVAEIWLSAHPVSTDFVDVTAHIDRKFLALRCHVSQLPDPDGMETRFRQMMSSNAVKAGFADGTFVEGFRVVQAM